MTKRRQFIKRSVLASLSTVIGTNIVFGEKMEKDYEPLFLQDNDPQSLFGKHAEMTTLNDRPWNIEAKAHLLDDAVTPEDRMFIRNNGVIPRNIDPENWTLTIEGESAQNQKSYTLNDLKTKFKAYTYQLTLECGGNGRSEFNPPAKGNQWTIGAVSCANWTGVRLKDLLADVGVNGDAVYIGYYGKDTHLSGDPNKVVISRGVPMDKAMQDETLVAFAMNGKDIPLAHGYPLRLVAGGFPASASGKWINRLVIRNIVHDGPKMTGTAYRVPAEPVAPGTEVPEEMMKIIESMPVKSLITYPKSGAIVKEGQSLEVRGHAWAGEQSVNEMDISIDFGATWQRVRLGRPKNRLAWQRWSADVKLPQKGYYEVWARATDSNGKSQPMVVPGWNPKGYLNNACHRIAVKVVTV
ncbi:sulfite oxidase [Roseivirga sp. E12]|uniref:sulfite oxidase n=1 Tax=Roseivirga sp. E12 TaxID=2819237 RepID=UPI001ABCEB6A|nr:sulfite oxidase [Roseivirga sp. E12]MBO3697968.1 sulfite oxidase [Roseivirga sp. E12]